MTWTTEEASDIKPSAKPDKKETDEQEVRKPRRNYQNERKSDEELSNFVEIISQQKKGGKKGRRRRAISGKGRGHDRLCVGRNFHQTTKKRRGDS